VSAYRAPRSTDPIAAPAATAPAAAPASDVGDDTSPTGPVLAAPSAPHPGPLPGGERQRDRELSDSEIERLAERVASKVVERLSDRVVKEVAWEVVPEMAELVVRERIRELESGAE
jgi:hypothetical protein